MRASSKRPRVNSSSFGAPPPPPSPPSSTGDSAADAYVDPTAAAAIPSLSTSDDSDIHCILEVVMTI